MRRLWMGIIAIGSMAATIMTATHEPGDLVERFVVDQQEVDRFAVAFAGPGEYSQDEAYQHLLLRTANLTLAEGFGSFKLVRVDRETKQWKGVGGALLQQRIDAEVIVRPAPADDEGWLDAEATRTELGRQLECG